MAIPDPIEQMESRIEANIARVTCDDGVLRAPCGNCGAPTKLEELTCMSPLGDDQGYCPVCFNDWKVDREAIRNEEGRE